MCTKSRPVSDPNGIALFGFGTFLVEPTTQPLFQAPAGRKLPALPTSGDYLNLAGIFARPIRWNPVERHWISFIHLIGRVSRSREQVSGSISTFILLKQPRLPCFKLGIRFGRPEMVKRFLRSGRTGFYLAVLEEGQVTRGDAIELIARDEHGVTVADIVNLYTADATNQDLLQKASELPALPTYWREHFRKRLWDPDS